MPGDQSENQEVNNNQANFMSQTKNAIADLSQPLIYTNATITVPRVLFYSSGSSFMQQSAHCSVIKDQKEEGSTEVVHIRTNLRYDHTTPLL